ncbi:DNA polymerase-3 subunit beta [Sporobacter termitidis DSM 10068]|uniref:Beta sliding clamp n=1 Tax=Sporobacter termitidis DSM 10068 TaxID=1123282 RepID=A0A1M5VUK4_9FIRM|nr:DNA polymerase III subunit beta [Sporobacter termitidis]SHH78860.1 DNA polymerase-3 subunit beta [Sporobacter termitidis DSM 10068]
MKFTVEKNLLQAAITTASRASAAKSAVPALEGLLVEAAGNNVKISGYDLKTGIITSVPADVTSEGAIVLSARLFGEIIRKLPDNIVSMAADESLMTKIECGMSEFQILGTPSADYPDLPVVDYQRTITISEKNLKSMIAQTNFAVSDNESRPIHTGALFEAEKGQLTIVAVDGYRLALRREQLENFDGSMLSFVVPGSALGEVEKIVSDAENPVSITLGSKHIMFVIGGTILISRRLEGEFLNYKNSIPHTEKYTIEVDRRAFVDAVERVSLIINDKLKSPVRCTFSDGVIKILSSTALGRASDECPVKGDGEELEIGFNDKYLLEALKAAPADQVRIKITSGISPCVIIPADGSSNFLYMILPVRLKANEG